MHLRVSSSKKKKLSEIYVLLAYYVVFLIVTILLFQFQLLLLSPKVCTRFLKMFFLKKIAGNFKRTCILVCVF
jgi:hypothetical protein